MLKRKLVRATNTAHAAQHSASSGLCGAYSGARPVCPFAEYLRTFHRFTVVLLYWK